MEWVETTGPTVAAAREAALDQLGVDERDAELVVVTEPRSGLFGFGRVEARVRARVRPAAPRPKRPQRRRAQGADRERRGEPRGERAEERPAGAGGGRRGRGRASAPAEATATAATAEGEGAGTRQAEEGPAAKPPGGGRSRQRGPRDRDAVRRRPEAEGDEQAARPRRTTTEESEMTIDQQAEAVERFVTGVVERFGYDDATTTVRVEDDHVFVDVTGGELGLLIGPRGRTLDALQELARTVVQRRGEEGGTRVVVDVAGFRAKRTAALEAFARRIAAEVVDQGAPQALEPMSAADRKVVHDTLTSVEGVHTSSEGVEPGRYVVIHPDTPAAAVDDEQVDDDD